MIQFQEYTIGWLAYILSVMGLLIVTWRLFRGVRWSYLRGLIQVSVLVFLATPAIGDAQYWAPAWIIAALELLFGGIEGAMPSILIIGKVLGVAVLAYTVISLIGLLFRRPNVSNSTSTSHPSKQASKRIPPRVL